MTPHILTIKDDYNLKPSEKYMDKSAELTRRIKEERLLECSFVACKLFQGATTGAEKRYFHISIRPWIRLKCG